MIGAYVGVCACIRMNSGRCCRRERMCESDTTEMIRWLSNNELAFVRYTVHVCVCVLR